jgi:hypothetical protein
MAIVAVCHRWPQEFEGHKFSNYIEWMKCCSLISGLDLPAVSVPCGVTAAGQQRYAGVASVVGAALLALTAPSPARLAVGGAAARVARSVERQYFDSTVLMQHPSMRNTSHGHL